MKDKVNAIPLIGEIIKEELNKQGKTTVWLAEQLGCHRTNIYKLQLKGISHLQLLAVRLIQKPLHESKQIFHRLGIHILA